MKLNDLKEYLFVPKKRYDISLDHYPNNSKLILIEIEKYCEREKLSYELIEESSEPIVKIDNVLCKCIVSTGGRFANYIINCREI